jgi:hypothetical protein
MAELDPKQIKQIQEQIFALKDSLTSLPDLLENIAGLFGKSNNAVKELNGGYKNIVSLSNQLEKSTYNLNYAFLNQKQLRKQVREVDTQRELSQIKYNKLYKQSTTAEKAQLKDVIKDINSKKLLEEQIAQQEFEGRNATTRQLERLDELNENIENKTDALPGLQKQAVAYKMQEVASTRLRDRTIETKKANDQINKSLGITGATLKMLNDFPGVSLFSDYFDIDEVNEDLINFIALNREAGVNVEGFAFKTRVLFKGLGSTLSNVFENATDPALVFGKILKSSFTADNQITELSKALSVVKSDGKDIRQEWVRYARTADSVFVTTTNMLTAQESLSKESEIAVAFTGKQLDDYIHLNKLIGLSDKATSNITRMGIINRKSTEETTKSFLKGAFAQQQIMSVSLNNKEILEEIGNLSGGTLIKFKGQEEAIGRAVVKAKALGLTMEQIDSFGESLLNWESSIENELQAELLTGKSLNLERARLAALTGDQLDLMSAISEQVGDLSSYQKMNIIQQKSLAQAFGMSRDEMSKMLIDQEKYNILGDTSKMNLQEQLDLAKQKGVSVESQLYQSLEQQAAADKFNQTVTKLQEMFTDIVSGPLSRMLDITANILSNVYAVKGIFVTIAAIMTGKMAIGLTQMIAKLIVARQISQGKAIADIAAAEAATLGAATPWILGGIAAASAAMLALMAVKPKEGNDIVSPGYGNRTLFGPEGSIALNNKDTVIAGTNLFPKQSQQNIPSNKDTVIAGTNLFPKQSQQNIPSIDLTPLVKIMNEVKIILQETKDVIKNKDTNVYMDSQKVGNQLNLSFNRTQ